MPVRASPERCRLVTIDRHEPQRTCVGCRERGDRSRLLRVVAGDASPTGVQILPDPSARAAGRGAWLHPESECLRLATRRRAFGRALRVQGAVEADAVTAYLEALARSQPPSSNESG
ncbi:MAG: YlxR family protein [Actinomycetales bacterium]